jgi:mannose-6-phosphate isomerase-like protein (cupin superfamily)
MNKFKNAVEKEIMQGQTQDDMIRGEQPDGPLEDYINRDFYEEWQRDEGVKVIRDFAFEDLRRLELGPWARKGGSGAVINIPNDVLKNDAHVVEIAPGAKSEPERHLYEETVYVLSGNGASKVWYDGQEPETFEWQAGSLFAIPLNAWYQHFNTGNQPARYIGVTTLPPILRFFKDKDFVFNNPCKFPSRFGGDEDYFARAKRYNRRVWETNFIPNAPDLGLFAYSERGAGGINAVLEMAGNSTRPAISEFPVGTYKKAHKHGPGAHLVILSGTGFSLLWTKDDMSDVRKCDWREGGMVIVPNDNCIHQHFNSGPTRARYLAFHPGHMGMRKPKHGGNLSNISKKKGGWQIEYEDQNPLVNEIFEAELAKHGAQSRMHEYLKKET